MHGTKDGAKGSLCARCSRKSCAPFPPCSMAIRLGSEAAVYRGATVCCFSPMAYRAFSVNRAQFVDPWGLRKTVVSARSGTVRTAPAPIFVPLASLTVSRKPWMVHGAVACLTVLDTVCCSVPTLLPRCVTLVARQERVWMPLKLWWRYKLLGGRLASLAQDRSSLLQLKEVYGEERFVLHFGPTLLWSVYMRSCGVNNPVRTYVYACCAILKHARTHLTRVLHVVALLFFCFFGLFWYIFQLLRKGGDVGVWSLSRASFREPVRLGASHQKDLLGAVLGAFAAGPRLVVLLLLPAVWQKLKFSMPSSFKSLCHIAFLEVAQRRTHIAALSRYALAVRSEKLGVAL